METSNNMNVEEEQNLAAASTAAARQQDFFQAVLSPPPRRQYHAPAGVRHKTRATIEVRHFFFSILSLNLGGLRHSQKKHFGEN